MVKFQPTAGCWRNPALFPAYTDTVTNNAHETGYMDIITSITTTDDKPVTMEIGGYCRFTFTGKITPYPRLNIRGAILTTVTFDKPVRIEGYVVYNNSELMNTREECEILGKQLLLSGNVLRPLQFP